MSPRRSHFFMRPILGYGSLIRHLHTKYGYLFGLIFEAQHKLLTYTSFIVGIQPCPLPPHDYTSVAKVFLYFIKFKVSENFTRTYVSFYIQKQLYKK